MEGSAMSKKQRIAIRVGLVVALVVTAGAAQAQWVYWVQKGGSPSGNRIFRMDLDGSNPTFIALALK